MNITMWIAIARAIAPFVTDITAAFKAIADVIKKYREDVEPKVGARGVRTIEKVNAGDVADGLAELKKLGISDDVAKSALDD